MEMNKKSTASVGYFQMPLHYPRYTKKDYEAMPEWQLDRLLEEYGLPAVGDLTSKKEFAMGAFLWPDLAQVPSDSATASHFSEMFSATLQNKVPNTNL